MVTDKNFKSTLLKTENTGIKNKSNLKELYRKNSAAFRDSVIILISAVLVVALSAYFNLFEMYVEWSRAHETWNIDEIIIVLAFLAFAFNIFSIRRGRELRHEIIRRINAEEEIKQQLLEKEIILKEIHHRIKNNIGSIRSLLRIHADKTSNTEAKKIIHESISRVESMYQIYTNLLPSEDYMEMSAKNYLENLIKSIIEIFPEKEKISAGMEIADFKLNVKQLFSLGAIVNELITNSVKYAFINRESGLIVIMLKRNSHEIILSVHDDGEGLPVDFNVDKSTGFGLILVKMLSQQLRGRFYMENNNGTRCIVTFKAELPVQSSPPISPTEVKKH